MKRRTFLTAAGSVLGAAAFAPPDRLRAAEWKELRLVAGARASIVERTALEDAAALFGRALDRNVPIVIESDKVGPRGRARRLRHDNAVASSRTDAGQRRAWRSSPSAGTTRRRAARRDCRRRSGRCRATACTPGWSGCGFAFFRDGETVPALRRRDALKSRRHVRGKARIPAARRHDLGQLSRPPPLLRCGLERSGLGASASVRGAPRHELPRVLPASRVHSCRSRFPRLAVYPRAPCGSPRSSMRWRSACSRAAARSASSSCTC